MGCSDSCSGTSQRNCTLSLVARSGRLLQRNPPSVFDLSDDACSDGGADISQHEAAQLLEVFV